MGMICKGVGVGLTIHPESYQAGVILSLHLEEGADDAESFIVLPANKARDIATRQAFENAIASVRWRPR